MSNLNMRQRVLVLGAPTLCLSMFISMRILTTELGKTKGYIGGFLIYWLVFCVPISLYCSKGITNLRKLCCQKSESDFRGSKTFYLLPFVPCIAIFFVVFMKYSGTAGIYVIGIAFLFALINAPIEELFWRGVFNKVFGNNIFFAYLYPSMFFGAWHIALYFAKGVKYQGGFASLVGGSFFMGLLWGWVAYKTKSIRVVIAAHMITNFFAFTGMIYENWHI